MWLAVCRWTALPSLLVAKDGLQVGTEKAWAAVEHKKLPRMFVISKLDEENSDFSKVFNELKDNFGKSIIAFQIPFVEGGKVTGIINVPKMKLVTFNGKDYQEKDVPDSVKDEVETYGWDFRELQKPVKNLWRSISPVNPSPMRGCSGNQTGCQGW